LLLACVVAASLGACAHPAANGNGSGGTTVTRRPQPPRFTHRRSVLEAAPATCDGLCAQYKAATAAAQYPQAANISVALTALTPSTSGLVWKNGRILMGTWTELSPFEGYKPGQSFPLDEDTWWTAVPVMKEWCQSTGLKGDALRLRIAQRLGMPPNATNDGFIEVWVDPKDLFRPCPDPETQDCECMVAVPMVAAYQPGHNEPPWPRSGVQLDSQFVQVQGSHLDWMWQNWESSYLSEDPYKNYPWTALGYTYDWGSSDTVGPSEFVSLDGTEVWFQDLAKNDAYCAPP
jgi:hypothetical protein